MPIVNPDWTPPIEMTFDEGKPIRSEQGLMLAGNPIAIAEGATGAPRLYLRAFEPLTAGDNIRSRNDASQTAEVTKSIVLHSFGFIQYGTIRARAEKPNPEGTLRLVRIRNFIETQLLSTTSTAVQTVDAAVIPGDTLSWILQGPISVGSTFARNARFSTGGEDLFPGPVGIRLEGNRNAL